MGASGTGAPPGPVTTPANDPRAACANTSPPNASMKAPKDSRRMTRLLWIHVRPERVGREGYEVSADSSTALGRLNDRHFPRGTLEPMPMAALTMTAVS